VLLGGVACRYPQTTLKWDSASGRLDLAEANQHLQRKYRAGWEVEGL
jgi:hypothetical protein